MGSAVQPSCTYYGCVATGPVASWFLPRLQLNRAKQRMNGAPVVFGLCCYGFVDACALTRSENVLMSEFIAQLIVH